MPDDKKDDCEAKNLISQGCIALQPIYGQDSGKDDQLKKLHNPSISNTYATPIGRKELATAWWESCPNQCMAHFPSNKPCTQYCKSLRKNVSILSKKMITTKQISYWCNEYENEGGSYTSNEKHVKRQQKLILITHPIALQKQQSDLIHITPNQLSTSSHSESLQTIHYNLRIGKDRTTPWMQFHVTVFQPRPEIANFTPSRNSSRPVKRTLDFYADNNKNEDMYSLDNKRKRSGYRNLHIKDDTLVARYKEMNAIARSRSEEPKRWNIPTNPRHDRWLADRPDDILLYHSEESECLVVTGGKPILSTQQVASGNTTTATPNDSSKQVPKVTPGTTDSIKVMSEKEFKGESLAEQSSLQRRLFPIDTFVLNKHCERLFQDEFIERHEKSSCPPSLDDRRQYSDAAIIGTNEMQSLSCEQENGSGDSDEEQYETYLSLPIPESYVPSTLRDDAKSFLAQPIPDSRIDDTEKAGSTSRALEECPLRTKVVDLSYHDWKNLKTVQQPTQCQMKSTSRFRQTMIELILMRNEIDNKPESDAIDRKQLWLPPLFNKQTMLSPSWKFIKDK